jgi:phosphatidylglycerol---prolipoprotein diacylglyceryl transferase
MVLYGKWKKVPIPLGMDIIAPCLMIGLAFGRIGCFVNGCCYGASCNLPWAVEFPYGSDAYVTQFAQNQLRMSVPRELIRDHSALGQYMDEYGKTQIQEPVPRDLLREIDSTSLKPREQIEKEAKTVVDSKGTTIADLVKAQHADPVHPAEIYSSITAFLIAAFLLAYLTLPHAPGRVCASMMIIEGIFRYVLEMLRVEPAVIGRGTHILSFLPPQSYSMVVSFFLVDGGLILWVLFGRLANARARQRFGMARPAAT